MNNVVNLQEDLNHAMQTLADRDFLTNVFGVIIQIILSVIIFTLIYKLIQSLIRHYFDLRISRNKFNDRNYTLKRLLLNGSKTVYLFTLTYAILTLIGIPIGTLLAGLGIVSFAIGFGAKDLVADIVNGFFILFEGQYNVGDYVIINGYEGEIKDITLRTTLIRSFDGRHHYLTNGDITEVTNLSKDSYRFTINILLAQDTPIDKLESVLAPVLQEAVKNDSRMLDRVRLAGLTTDQYERTSYRFDIWMKDASDDVEVPGDYRKLIINTLKENEITVPLSHPIEISNLWK